MIHVRSTAIIYGCPIFIVSVISVHACRVTQKLGKTQFIVGSKGFTLCRRNEFGTINLQQKVMIKQTNLYREWMLRIDSRKIAEEYYNWELKGMLSWEAFKENRESIKRSSDIIARALHKYKDRRIKAGYFYMCKHRTLHAVIIMSPLYTMPQREALKKIRKILRRREAYASISNNATLGTNGHGSNLAKYFGSLGNIGQHRFIQVVWLIYLFVITIACITIFYV